MIEEDRPCLEVAQLEGCIDHSGDDKPAEIKKKMRELKEIAKYL
jgi:hypothetical protein